jgi:hypothetical protein
MSDEKLVARKAEVQRLLDAGLIRKVHYPSWLANVVIVKKKNGKWRMRIDFTDLNKCCRRTIFSLSRIDYFSGYHQIWLHKEDEDKTSFITPFSAYCYLRMFEGLKNIDPTFYRMMKTILKDQM